MYTREEIMTYCCIDNLKNGGYSSGTIQNIGSYPPHTHTPPHPSPGTEVWSLLLSFCMRQDLDNVFWCFALLVLVIK